jgi:hypothetical protein
MKVKSIIISGAAIALAGGIFAGAAYAMQSGNQMTTSAVAPSSQATPTSSPAPTEAPVTAATPTATVQPAPMTTQAPAAVPVQQVAPPAPAPAPSIGFDANGNVVMPPRKMYVAVDPQPKGVPAGWKAAADPSGVKDSYILFIGCTPEITSCSMQSPRVLDQG